ncbi:hypothetical protein IP69_04660 [Bosea sp. AAP35]|uniref:hypothetical protein n=1 Tax=Bosea sp. AAP35 TaxID=1523417 RepID=UPI0006B9EE69|nr:hypothetical protein [Bosea sp. AAP35]KPF71791.1 hypothetical protein IP69_04660 [Bosea sp. AAP35]
MTEASVTVILTGPQQDALDAYRRSANPVISRDEALQSILSEWLAHHTMSASPDGEADEGLKPDELNASNDI